MKKSERIKELEAMVSELRKQRKELFRCLEESEAELSDVREAFEQLDQLAAELIRGFGMADDIIIELIHIPNN